MKEHIALQSLLIRNQEDNQGSKENQKADGQQTTSSPKDDLSRLSPRAIDR